MLKSIVFMSSLIIVQGVFAQSTDQVKARMVSAGSVVANNDSLAWRITQPEWTDYHERAYSDFVVSIATAYENKECKDIDSCMRSPRNIYRSSADSRFAFGLNVDCGRLPYVLRSYFAWKNGLPFSYTAGVQPRVANDPSLSSGLQYTTHGNVVVSRAQVTGRNNASINFASFQATMLPSVFTASLRTAHRQNANEPINDFYSVAIDRSQIRPGTVIYYPEGHAAVVFKVNPDGSIKTFEAHPGNFLSVKAYGEGYTGVYSNQLWGGGLKNFRPMRLQGASVDRSGFYVGGSVVLAKDYEIYGVDYFQTTAKSQFPTTRDFTWFLSERLQSEISYINLEDSFTNSLNNLCTFMKDRVRFVSKATEKGTDAVPHPDSMPRNILLGDSTDPRWEEATFGRDITVKRTYREVLTDLQFFVRKYQAGDQRITTRGGDVKQSLEQIYNDVSRNCIVSYVSRDNSTQRVNLEQLRQRIFKLSSDPYICVDYRWGDTARGQALCSEDSRWYNAQQFLRNQTSRDDLTKTDATGSLSQLEQQNARLNRPVQWDTDYVTYIRGLRLNPMF